MKQPAPNTMQNNTTASFVPNFWSIQPHTTEPTQASAAKTELMSTDWGCVKPNS